MCVSSLLVLVSVVTVRILISQLGNSKFAARRLEIRSCGAGFEVRSSEIRSSQLGGSRFVVAGLDSKFAAWWLGILLCGSGNAKLAARRNGVRSCGTGFEGWSAVVGW